MPRAYSYHVTLLMAYFLNTRSDVPEVTLGVTRYESVILPLVDSDSACWNVTSNTRDW